MHLQQDDFLVVRLVLEEGISQEYFDNDMILLSKDDPNVSTHAGCPAEAAGCDGVQHRRANAVSQHSCSS